MGAVTAAQGEIGAPIEPLLGESLDAIAEALRRFPEVQWACELSDDGPLPVIGLRVDPSFMSRVAEISAAVSRASSDDVSVLLLSDAKAMRDARAHGTVFFPWRKKR